MDINEFQAKRLFGKYGVPVPVGDVAETAAEARAIAEKIGGVTVVKAQVLIGGRGKAGGVKVAKTAEAAEMYAEQILGMDIKGLTVNKVLIDPGADIADELYLAIMIDRSARKPMIMASAEGGMDIEQVNHDTPEKIIRVHIDPVICVKRYHSVGIASQMGLPAEKFSAFHKVLTGLYDCFVQSEATLTEVNPLIVQGDGSFSAIDGKMSLDDNALPRHPELAAMRDPASLTDNEVRAKEAGINYIQLDGNIGCLVNGAGLAEKAGEALEEIETVSGRMAELISGISTSAGQVTEMASKVSNAMASINEVTAQTSETSVTTASSVAKLDQLAQELRQSVAGFRLPEQQAVG